MVSSNAEAMNLSLLWVMTSDAGGDDGCVHLVKWDEEEEESLKRRGGRS